MRPIIEILNAATDEVERREMNDAEFAQFQADQIAAAKLDEKLESEKAKAQAKKSELLEKLGITEEEAKLLLA